MVDWIVRPTSSNSGRAAIPCRIPSPFTRYWPRIPEPDQSLPIEYRNRGIRVGDVGLMTEDCGFDFLFNVHTKLIIR
ncbi:hypothetical protein BDZ89DRAFT_953712 [Hymenopellis radicata]|nr:hypothetical protein BDZ89DRAFT_953712 [Hymenopellis radicata]